MRSRRSIEIIPPQLLVEAYSRGYFPMADSETGKLGWYTADPRATLPLDPFHVPRRLQRAIKSAPFTCTRDTCFERVMRACADREDTWINEALVQSYTRLHELGFAHSVETWENGELVGGLYGVALGGAFFGESMFNRVSDASKAALVHLAGHLQERGFRLLEIQMVTPLTAQFRPKLVSRREYLPLLSEAIAAEAHW
ncbi:MAG: leucyl/phenylalanyl-tRNA--protein transferase [Armatimonadota bacterium]